MPNDVGVLAVLGLRSDAEELYRGLLRGPRSEAPSLLRDWSEERLLTAVAELVDAGLVSCEADSGLPDREAAGGGPSTGRPSAGETPDTPHAGPVLTHRDPGGAPGTPGTPPPRQATRLPVEGGLTVRVVEPAVAVRALLTRTEREIEDSRQRLAVARAAVEQMEADYLRTRVEDLGTPQIEVVDATLAPSVLLPLVRGSSGPVHTLHHCRPEHGTADRAVFEALAEAAEAGRVLRGIYPTEVLDDPRWEAWARRRAAIGERQRLTARLLPAVTIVGRDAVVVGPAGTRPLPAREEDVRTEDETGTVLVSRAPQLVDAFRDVFDGWWQASAPIPDDEEVAERERLLGFLAAGCKDETVARLLGLSVRTVRRRVAELMAEYEVSTRLQLGVEAVRRGVL